MDFELSLITQSHSDTEIMQSILGCNSYLTKYGIRLTEEDALVLKDTCEGSLRENGRIEVGTGITEKLIKAFCSSPYITPSTFTDVVSSLTEIFYYYKSDMLELADDDELIEYMRDAFNNRSQGSLEHLAEKELSRISENLRAGLPPFYEEPEALDEDEECEEGLYE